MTGTIEDAEQALDDLRKVDLSDPPLLLNTRVEACQAAAHAYAPHDPRRDRVLSQAARDVERLALHRDNPVALQGRCKYYFVRGDDDALLAAARQARKDRVEAAFVTDLEVCVLYGRKEFDEALRALQSTKYAGDESFLWLAQGIVLAAIPGRKQEAEKAMTEAIRVCKGSPLSNFAAYLQLLGPEYAAKARQASLEIRERSAHLIPTSRDRWYHDVLAFHAGLIDAEELLKKAGESRFNQCEAHCYIGLRRLGEGNRAEAMACFRRSVDTGVFSYVEYIWCRAFLAHIDDPDWLPWMSTKPQHRFPR